MPYMPPEVRRRRKEKELWELEKAEWRRRLAEEDAAPATSSTHRPPNVRALARKWEPKLERCGTSCFNPLQKDDGVEVDDSYLLAECIVEPILPRSGPGVKGLPMVSGGRYHYEVE